MSTAPPVTAGRSVTSSTSESSPRERWPFATVSVGVVALVFALVCVLTTGRYGYFGDELYFLAAGHHPAFGYADQPPGVPLLARAMQSLFPDSLVGLRAPSLLAAVGYLVLTALSARELGANRVTQVCAAGVAALAPHLIASAHLLVTYSFDQTLWACVVWLLLRAARREHQGQPANGSLLAAGLVTAVAVQFKLLIPVLWLVAVPMAMLFGPRRLVLRPGLWLGGLLAVLSAAPGLWWQARNGWPQLAMARVVDGETTGGVRAFLNASSHQLGPVGTVLVLIGLCGLLVTPALRPHRFLGAAAVVIAVLFVVVSGRSYYTAGLYAVLLGAGAVVAQLCWTALGKYRHRWPRWVAAAVVIACCLFTGLPPAVGTLPLTPAPRINPHNVVGRASLAWPSITEQVARVYRELPRDGTETAVVTRDYWSAGALHHFGPRHGIPEVHSTSRGFWYLSRPDDTVRRVVYLGGERERLRELFGRVRAVDEIETDPALPTYYDGMRIWVLEDPKLPWSRLWPRMHHMSLW
ncbi:Dolichyl-phosphate-mannose-protein mannosyltransferase [Actinopolyspora xinjiangensis]|uniref:Dolichyl-phosphate-mannose-protein mannosyltransferase n=1 Tax=Actinopolyspora xinjiangensis TaxID=405564 RepID=A0A1H0RGR0_9ACTN|nr:glycosyltransferase family 39 protein [Actinopolyspora xinjiangensis]SDP28088.1 Dolichyl-phosphate-mannose-protein mannosyltransferase [Actinopolyspora xinjiangensis]